VLIHLLRVGEAELRILNPCRVQVQGGDQCWKLVVS
jgi:hypothetical protein